MGISIIALVVAVLGLAMVFGFVFIYLHWPERNEADQVKSAINKLTKEASKERTEIEQRFIKEAHRVIAAIFSARDSKVKSIDQYGQFEYRQVRTEFQEELRKLVKPVLRDIIEGEDFIDKIVERINRKQVG